MKSSGTMFIYTFSLLLVPTLIVASPIVMIDNFEEGTINSPSGVLVDTVPDSFDFQTDTQSGLSPLNVIGGERETWVRLHSGTAASITLKPSALVDDGLSYSINPNSDASFQFYYGSNTTPLSPALANHDRFRFIFSAAPNTGTLYLGVNTSDGKQGLGGQFNLNGPGSYDIEFIDLLDEFSAAPVDMSLANLIFINLRAQSDSQQLDFHIAEIYAIPEPTTATLMIAILFPLLIFRRRKIFGK